MKKNRFLKVACAMVILCLITTCAVSTTFAKYTTGGSASDEARVAKWGVKLSMVGDTIFANQYEDVTNGITVEATTDVVAPGTSSSEANAAPAVFAITGTPVLDSRRSGSLTTFLSKLLINANITPNIAPNNVANTQICSFLGAIVLKVLIGKSIIRAKPI